jgi:Cu(I)/Ag(I) efflux system membrane protein CusA/SilA
LPFATVGSFWLLYILQFNLSIAVAVGLIALTGIAAEFGIIMLLYLDNAYKAAQAKQTQINQYELRRIIDQGAVLRLRPKVMTLAIIIAGLIPIMIGVEAGSNMMQHIAAPMIGGMITAPLLSLFVIPVLYFLWKKPTS